MNEMNSTEILDYMRTVGVTTSSDLNGYLSRYNYKTGTKNKIASPISKYEKERNEPKMKVNQLTCVGCIHSDVCKYKESMEKLQESLKTFIGSLSPEEEEESGCNINISCDYYSNGFSTITSPWYPNVTQVDVRPLGDVTPINYQKVTIGDPATSIVDIDEMKATLPSEKTTACNSRHGRIEGTTCTSKEVPFTPTYEFIEAANQLSKLKLSRDDFHNLVNLRMVDMINDQNLKERVESVMSVISHQGNCDDIMLFDWNSYFNNLGETTVSFYI